MYSFFLVWTLSLRRVLPNKILKRHALVITHFHKGDTFFYHRIGTIKRHCLATFDILVEQPSIVTPISWSNDNIGTQPNLVTHISWIKDNVLIQSRTLSK